MAILRDHVTCRPVQPSCPEGIQDCLSHRNTCLSCPEHQDFPESLSVHRELCIRVQLQDEFTPAWILGVMTEPLRDCAVRICSLHCGMEQFLSDSPRIRDGFKS